jgi:meso-butanediol dehydrogenase / (S,S)-butanediol dehydrogenase / diacetyl reductase
MDRPPNEGTDAADWADQMGEAMRLVGKVAIVTGGGTGIGAATARRFATEGAKVVVTGRRPEPIEAVAAEIGGRAVAGDTADEAHVRAAVEATREAFGGLDVVVASAGGGFFGAAGEVDDHEWQRTLDVNVTGALRLVRAALPSLIERGGGSIVLISSTAAFVSDTENAAYVTSKAAMIGLARSLAVDYGPLGVRANALCPGWVVTPLGDSSMESLIEEKGITREGAYRLVTKHTPLRRPATAEEVASCCLFLACEESAIVTGTAMIADCGLMSIDPTVVASTYAEPP